MKKQDRIRTPYKKGVFLMFFIKQIGIEIAVFGMIIVCGVIAVLRIKKGKNEITNIFEMAILFTIVVCLIKIVTL
ncbi:hypothetical protein [Latilactobacillus curvatus]|uniref:hypothetical protein n=2 Tax=Latilactobacillus curvatus TaxID=28038 RepID=UPI0013C2D6A9|nr:hypothetical protein [Latilactobacillus curvatus]